MPRGVKSTEKMGAIISRIRQYLSPILDTLYPLFERPFSWLFPQTSLPRYQYSPLQKRQIRLLALYPPKAGCTDLILRLVPYDLDSMCPDVDDDGELEGPRYYDAASYVWEEDVPANRTSLICDGRIVHNVPKNLVAFLHRVQSMSFTKSDNSSRHVPVWVWADAVCINQQDNADKAHQVGLMAEIYSKARNVIIWLGIPLGPDLDGEVRFLNRLLGVINKANAILPEVSLEDPNAMQPASRQLLGPELQALQALDWEPLRILLGSPWFDRKWIVQEAALAANPGIIVADRSLLLKLLTSLTMRILAYGLHAHTLLYEDVDAAMAVSYRLYNLSHIDAITYFRQRRELNLLDVAKMTRMFRCTRAEDHVYGILALALDDPPQPDDASTVSNILHQEDMYDIPAEEVFFRFAKYHVDRGDLGFLALAPHRSLDLVRSQMEEDWPLPPSPPMLLPSWVPDLRRQEMDVISSHSMKKHHFHAGGGDFRLGNYHVVGRVLQCRGWVIDTIAEMLPCTALLPLPQYPDSPTPHFTGVDEEPIRRILRQADFYTQCAQLACSSRPGSGTDVTDMSEDRFADFWKTMTCERLHLLDRIDPSEDYSADMRTFYVSLLTFIATRDVELAKIALDGYMPLALTMDTSFGITASRRFGATTLGRLCMAPAEARTGDELMILPGVEIPFVVRRVEGCSFEMVGDAYVSRMMDAEVVGLGYELCDIFLV